jgi:N-acetylmuramoyl-L-alanine amidase
MSLYHTVIQGECLASISKKYKFLNYRTIYDAPENAALRQKRPNPNILFPGDRLFIPSKQSKTEQCPTGSAHTFQISRQKLYLCILLKSDPATPYANKKYELEVGGKTIRGNTDQTGLLWAEVPADAATGTLKFWPGEKESEGIIMWKLSLGHLDPSDTATGAQARLNNLGFYCGAVDGVIGPKTKRALHAFQRVNGLPATGGLDAATSALLEAEHDILS